MLTDVEHKEIEQLLWGFEQMLHEARRKDDWKKVASVQHMLQVVWARLYERRTMQVCAACREPIGHRVHGCPECDEQRE